MSTDQQDAPAGEDADWSPRVFISYSHDSPEHKDQVLRFGTFLRAEAGVDTHLDRWYEGARRDWSAWVIEQLAKADFIVIIASPAYKRRADGFAPPEEGRGAQFEAAIIRDNLTRNLPAETRRVLPVVLPGRSVEEIPAFLSPYCATHYIIEEFTVDGVEELLRAFTDHPEFERPVRGRFVGPRAMPGGRRAPADHPDPPDRPAGRRSLLTATLRPVRLGSDVRMGGADLDGTHYGNSIVLRPYVFSADTKGIVEYDLGRRYRYLEAVAGVLDDAAESDQTGCFEIVLDGEPRPQIRVQHGKPATVRIDVSGVLRLRLVAYRPGTIADPLMAGARLAGGRSNRLPELAWGDPTLVE